MEKMQPETRLERLRRKLQEAEFTKISESTKEKESSEKEALSESPLSWKSDARSYLSTISSIEKCFDAAYRDGALSSRDLSDANSSLSDVASYLRRLS